MVESFGKITRSVVKRFNPDAGARMSMNHYREKLEKELSTDEVKTNFELNKALSNLCNNKSPQVATQILKELCIPLEDTPSEPIKNNLRNRIKQTYGENSSPTLQQSNVFTHSTSIEAQNTPKPEFKQKTYQLSSSNLPSSNGFAGLTENQQNNINTNSRSQDSTQTNSTQQKSPPSLPPRKQGSISAEKQTNPTSFKTLKEQKEFLDKLEDENYDIRTNEDMWGILLWPKNLIVKTI